MDFWKRRMKKRPILRGFPISNTQIAVYCPYCDYFHKHGWDQNEGNDAGDLFHKVAHCSNPYSPFKNGGYYVALHRKSDKSMFGG
jgi:hypothetical protein